MKHFQQNLKSLESVDGTKNATQVLVPDKKKKKKVRSQKIKAQNNKQKTISLLTPIMKNVLVATNL
jgi:hypothetical protein